MSAPFVSTESLSTMTITDINDADNTSAAASDELHTPSTVKSNTASPKSSIQESPTQPKFKYGNEVMVQQVSFEVDISLE